MGALDLTTSRTSVQVLHVLESLSSHLSVALLHVGCLLLWYRTEDGFPDTGEYAIDTG